MTIVIPHTIPKNGTLLLPRTKIKATWYIRSMESHKTLQTNGSMVYVNLDFEFTEYVFL